MGKNNKGLVYLRLINATVLYLLITLLYLLYSTLNIYGRYNTVVVFDPPTLSTIKFIVFGTITHWTFPTTIADCLNKFSFGWTKCPDKQYM